MARDGRTGNALSLIRRVWRLTLRQHRWAFIGVCFLQLLYVPLGLLQPVPLRLLADQVIGGAPFPLVIAQFLPAGSVPWWSALLVLGLATILISGATQLHNVAAWMAATAVEQRTAFALRMRLFEHVQSVPINHLETAGTSDALYRISQDANAAKELTVGLTRYLVSLVTIIGFGAAMFSIDPLMSLVALAPAPFAFLLLRKISGRIRDTWRASFSSSNQAFNVLGESLSLSRVIRAFSRAPWHSANYRSLSDDAIRHTVAAVRAEALMDSVLGLLFSVGQAALLILGAISIRRQTMTLGDLLVFHAYTVQIYAPLAKLSRMTGDLQQQLAMADRALSLLALPTERIARADQQPLERALGYLELQGISYAYPSRPDHPVLCDLSLTIPAGSMVGITGPSGSGKSTLLDLLLGFAEPARGRILMDGVDMSTIVPSDRRRQFALVTQDPVLFSASIAENVRYGRPDASDEEVVHALDLAGAGPMVNGLFDGVETLVGERGAALSGGQRQRVAIARALLRNAPFLLLDEPTSALDADTERAILSALHHTRRVYPTRTVVVVTHSASLLAACDRVVSLDKKQHAPVQNCDHAASAAKE